MATLNKTAKGRMMTTNRSGHAAYRLDDRTRLVTMALTTMLGEPKYYGDNTDELIALAEDMCKRGDGEFVARLAVWARTKGNLRSVSHALIAVCARWCHQANDGRTKSFVRKAASDVARMRGDDGTETMAAYWALYGNDAPFPNALRRGIRDALETFGPYQIAKYQSANRQVKMRDGLRLSHPVPQDGKASEAMGRCIDGTLPFPKSWETELSARGNTKEVWDELISEGKVPFMAALRNLRNMMRAGADIDPVLAMLSDREAVARSRQLPFRFYSAYRELVYANMASTKVAKAIDMALVHACRNADRLVGRTAVLIDTSGSMSCHVSSKSTVTCQEIASVLGAMATHISDDAAVIAFDSHARVVPMSGLSILSDIGMVPAHGGWTNMDDGFDCLMSTGFDADRVVVLSDYEVNRGRKTVQSKMDEYRRAVGHDVWCHAIDLQGYGTQQFIGGKTNVIAGWSEQVLRFVPMAERGFDSIVDEVNGLEL